MKQFKVKYKMQDGTIVFETVRAPTRDEAQSLASSIAKVRSWSVLSINTLG